MLRDDDCAIPGNLQLRGDMKRQLIAIFAGFTSNSDSSAVAGNVASIFIMRGA